MPQFILKISEPTFTPLKKADAGCFILSAALPKDFVASFIAKASAQKCLTLLEGEGALLLCKELNADGVVIKVNDDSPYKKQLKPAREALTNGKVLGVICPPSRHAAMIVSEIEPEFVGFSWHDRDTNLAELIKWYNDLFLIQSAIEISGNIPEVETDFIIMPAKDFGC